MVKEDEASQAEASAFDVVTPLALKDYWYAAKPHSGQQSLQPV